MCWIVALNRKFENIIYCFETDLVINEAERLMEMAEKCSLLGCHAAQYIKRDYQQKGNAERAAFYSVVETYCYYMECCSNTSFHRFNRALMAGEYCTWPHYNFTSDSDD